MGIVRFEGTTPKMAREAMVMATVMTVVFVSMPIVAAVAGRQWGFLALIPFCGFPAFIAWIQAIGVRKMIGRGAFVSEEAFGALADGEVAWALPWSDYGGYSPIQQRPWQRTLCPERGGVEILNRHGLAVGTLPVGSFSADHLNNTSTRTLNAGSRFILRALREKMPKDSPYAELANPPRKLLSRWAAASFLVFASMATVGSVGLTAVMSRHAGDEVRHWSAIFAMPAGALSLMGVLVVSIVLFAWAGADLYAHRHPELRKPPEIPMPQEGPAEVDFLISRDGGLEPVELEDGVRYRCVHPELRERQLDANLRGSHLLYVIGIALLLMFVFVAAVTPAQKPMDPAIWVVAPFMVSPVLLMPSLYKRSIAKSKERLYDTIIKHDGQITIVHRDGSHETFSPRAKFKKDPNGVNEVLVEGRHRYAIDRRRLYASETPLDSEEIAEMNSTLS